MSAVGTLETPSANEPPLLLTIEEAADMLRIGRTLAYALARRYEAGGLEGLPVIRLGNCLRVPRWALLELARIDQIGREAELDLPQGARPVVQLSSQARSPRAVRPRSRKQLRLLRPS